MAGDEVLTDETREPEAAQPVRLRDAGRAAEPLRDARHPDPDPPVPCLEEMVRCGAVLRVEQPAAQTPAAQGPAMAAAAK